MNLYIFGILKRIFGRYYNTICVCSRLYIFIAFNTINYKISYHILLNKHEYIQETYDFIYIDHEKNQKQLTVFLNTEYIQKIFLFFLSYQQQ